MRKLLLAAAGAAAMASASMASAAITFAGGSQGCFTLQGASPCTPTTTSTDNGLTYTGGPLTFTQTTDSSGFAGIGGTTNNFGTITLGPSGHTYTGDTFSLLVNFSAPVGSGTGNFAANLLGSLTSFGVGGVNINFLNGTQTISSSSIGPFTLHVNDVAFSGAPAGTDLVLRQDISGYIQAAGAVPEPATWAMMLIGFLGIGTALRRSRRPVLAQLA